jgi:threonine synthase
MLVGIMAGARRLAEAGRATSAVVPVGVQGAGCAPIARAFAEGAETVESWPGPVTGSAGSINDPLIGYAADGTRTLSAIRAGGGEAIAVDDDAIADAMTELGATEGLGCEPAAAATLAALRQIDVRAPLPRPVVLVLSGHALKDPSAPLRACAALRVAASVDPVDLARQILTDDAPAVA